MTVGIDNLAHAKKNPPQAGGWRRSVFFKPLLVVFGIAALGLSIRFGWHYLINLDTFKVKPGTFSFDLPSWAKVELLDKIRKAPIVEESHSIFERDLTKNIAEAYSGKPWVAKVHYVKKEFPNKIKIKFSLRKPFAVVKKGESFYLLDSDCVRLSEKLYYWPDDNPEALFIRSNKLSKAPAYWEKWDDAGVQAGVNLVKFLRKNKVHKLLNITTIDVSNVNTKHDSAKSDIVLTTKNGTQIKWGCSSAPGGCKMPGELSDTEKLQNLLSVAKAEGRNLSRMEYVDVRWDIPQGKLH
ncbi:MAG TPA: hypothetical protein VI387_08770 [Candidatus Brocadiales bacterium]|nr:hypothetical protein [Candidatus Brocadiales bacterium]